VTLVSHARDCVHERAVKLFEVTEEAFCDRLDVECLPHAVDCLNQAQAACFRVELADVHEHCAEFGDQQVPGLALHIGMATGIALPILALDPIPEAAGALSVEEDQKVLVEMPANVSVDRAANYLVWDHAIGISHLEDDHARQLSDWLAGDVEAVLT